jgi:glutaminase
VQLEQENGIPRNPFINAGAITTTDIVLANNTKAEALAEILQFVRHAASDNSISINESVASSESRTGHKNIALAHFMSANGTLENTTEDVLDTYFQQCAIEMTNEQLAKTGRNFAGFDGDFPNLNRGIISSINALMMIAGHYNGSGDFAKRVGIPGKSGVGGGILAIVPNKASISVWSPGLNQYGNSKAGTLALEKLSCLTGWSLFT